MSPARKAHVRDRGCHSRLTRPVGVAILLETLPWRKVAAAQPPCTEPLANEAANLPAQEGPALLRRLRWFARNAGYREGAKCAVLLALVVLLLMQRSSATTRWYSVALMVAPFGLTYCLRPMLVRDPPTTQRVLNTLVRVVVIAAIVLPVLFPGGVPGAWIVFPILLGAYLGCFFWFLSDETVLVQR